MNSAIVVVAYNRPKSTHRLLLSLINSMYDTQDTIDLIVSIDYGPLQHKVESAVNSIIWQNGSYKVITHKQNLGLRNHVLLCGEYTKSYDFVIILEDDLTVSNSFYFFAREAIQKYGNDAIVAGISLYKHNINIPTLRPFIPLRNGTDAFFFQYAQSWGQCYNSRMWNEFIVFYTEMMTDNQDINSFPIPKYIKSWSSKSWLKYFMAYIVVESKYFVYPYVSLTTNHTEIGVHNSISSSDFHVELERDKVIYTFPNLIESPKYDVYFEIENLSSTYLASRYPNRKIVFDLYGTKETYDGDILITSRYLRYQVLDRISLNIRPHEANLINPEYGNGINVYDLNEKSKYSGKFNPSLLMRYDLKNQRIWFLIVYVLSLILNRVKKPRR